MTDISEDWFFAGWLTDLEYILWSIATKDGKWKGYHYQYLCDTYGDELKSKGEEENKWYYWSGRTKWINEMPLDMWIRKYKRNATKVFAREI